MTTIIGFYFGAGVNRGMAAEALTKESHTKTLPTR